MDIKITSMDIKSENVVNKCSTLLDGETMTRIQATFAEVIDPWTPFLSGELHSNLSIDSSGVTYNVDYSAKKYYGTVYCKEYHPLATSHWDEVAMQTEMPVLEEKVKRILIERVKALYG